MSDASARDIERIVKAGDILAGKYLVERVLGVGGMGVVVAATHTQLDQRVAIKFLLPAMLPNREVVERFQREARAAAKIKSEHVVRVSDVGTLDAGVPYIVMEFLEGRDLGELLSRRGPLPIALAVDYVLEATEALAEAHAAGIVHRDLKPANLFLSRRADETEIVKVLDFGISKQISAEALVSNPSLTKTTDVFGSPTYMSPEQLKASRDVDVRADIWALGVILFELVSGAPPFGGGTVAEIFGAILHKPAPRLRETRKDAPAELERVLLRCLEKEASARFQNVGDLAEALMPFGSDASRESTARVSRVLRASGPMSRISNRGSQSGGRGPLGSDPRASRPDGSSPAIALGADGAVEASTGVGADKKTQRSPADADISASPGSATSTSWGHVKPTGKPSSSGRLALIALALGVAAAGGAFVVLKLMNGGDPSHAGAATSAPSAEARPATTSASGGPATDPSTVVVPAPTASTSAESPTVTPGASIAPSALPKPGGKVPVASPTATASAAAAAGPTAKPTATPAAPPTAPPVATGDDGEFGGRR